MRVRGWNSLPTPNIVKMLKGIYLFLANLYAKLTILAILTPLSPHF